MAYIVGLIIVGCFFLTLQYFTQLSKKQKVVVSIVVLVIILSAIAFNSASNSQREKMLQVVTKFNQNKTVNCQGLDVNNSNYTISIGTYTFIGKENTQNYGKMISASNCQ